MGITESRKKELTSLCKRFRIDVIKLLYDIQTGHPGGSLSVCEILTALYFEKARIDENNLTKIDRDRIILTKGHGAPMLYRILAEKGFFPIEEMKTLRQINSRLQGHPSAIDTPGVELSSGPLGIGLSAALGMAIGLKLSNVEAYVYAIMGDGEINEGSVWEASMAASKFKADNLIAIIDYNGVQLDGSTDEIMPLGDIEAKFKAFGFEVFKCDGHDIIDICNTIDLAKGVKDKPSMIIADTIKGKGVSFMEGKNIWHGRPINKQEFKLALAELEGEQ